MRKGFLMMGLVLMTSLVLAEEEGQKPLQNSLEVEIKIGTGIEDRKLVGMGESFPASTEQMVGWTRVKGATEPTEITHVWILNGTEKASITLPVKSVSYRTWSRKDVRGETGQWTFIVKGSDGNTLGSTNFIVGEQESPDSPTP